MPVTFETYPWWRASPFVSSINELSTRLPFDIFNVPEEKEPFKFFTFVIFPETKLLPTFKSNWIFASGAAVLLNSLYIKGELENEAPPL